MRSGARCGSRADYRDRSASSWARPGTLRWGRASDSGIHSSRHRRPSRRPCTWPFLPAPCDFEDTRPGHDPERLLLADRPAQPAPEALLDVDHDLALGLVVAERPEAAPLHAGRISAAPDAHVFVDCDHIVAL